MERTLAAVLLAGVLTSAVLLAAGLGLLWLSPPAAAGRPADLAAVLDLGATGPTGSWSLRILSLGVLVLLATPLLRLLSATILFARERDWLYVAVGAAVLAIVTGAMVFEAGL